MNWVVEQLMKLAAGTCFAGIAWVILVGVMAIVIPFWVIWIVAVLLVYGVVFCLEHSDNHWDIF
jgi:hypothetical protein